MCVDVWMFVFALQEAPKRLEAEEGIVNQLIAIGFSQNRSKRACLATKNAGVEAAMEWIFPRMDDPTLDDPSMLML